MSQSPTNNDEKTSYSSKDDKPQPAIHTPKQNNTITKYDKNNRQSKQKISWPSKLTAVCTFAIVIITGFYTYYAREQAVQMKEAVKIASDTAMRQLRAYIHIDKMTIRNVADPLQSEIGLDYIPTGAEITNPKSGPSIEIYIKNSGQTPAYNSISWGIVSVREYPLTSPLPEISHTLGRRSTATLPPQGGSTIYAHFPTPLTEDQKAALRMGNIAIYIHGGTKYTDIFGKEHKTNFQGMHGIMTKTIGINNQMAQCDEGNKAD